MDIFSFVNSSDIREHLKKLDYKFNSIETSWLIYQCKSLSYVDKKKAWLELIDTMPDCEIEERPWCKSRKSLHDFLREYIAANDELIEWFYKEELEGRYVYTYSYYYKGDPGWTEEHWTSYPSLQACIDAFYKDIYDLGEIYGGTPEENGIEEYEFRKQSLDNVEDEMRIRFMGKGEPDFVEFYAELKEEKWEILHDFFEGLWLDFPTPFKKGDIVWEPEDMNNIKWDMDGPFVLEGISTWEPAEYMKRSGDNSDMTAYGYFVNDVDGTIYNEVSHTYMNLEFYKGDCTGNMKILPALSKYIKGEVDIVFLLTVYRKIMFDLASDHIMLHSWFPKEWIRDVGIEI